MIIEKEILDHLVSEDIEGIKENIYCERPEEPPDEYVLIERTSGTSKDMVAQAMVAVQSISTQSLYRAMVMDEAIVSAMRGMADSAAGVYGCHLNSHYNFTNTQTKEYRYQAVFLINYQED